MSKYYLPPRTSASDQSPYQLDLMIAGDKRLLVGRFLAAGLVLKPDEIEQRIDVLLSNWLIHLADDPVTGAWRRLYRDPSDGRLWELTFLYGLPSKHNKGLIVFDGKGK